MMFIFSAFFWGGAHRAHLETLRGLLLHQESVEVQFGDIHRDLSGVMRVLCVYNIDIDIGIDIGIEIEYLVGGIPL